jgi:LCP family protein required for cell wall assembly
MRRITSTARTRSKQLRAQPRQRGSGCKSIFVGLAAIGLLAAFVVFVFARLASQSLAEMEIEDVGSSANSPQTTDETTGEPVQMSSRALDEPFNVLLLGVDTRDDPEDGARSDTLIVVHVEPEEQWASMLSIPRDSVVDVPHLGQQKINAAYTYGYQNATSLYGTGTRPQEGGSALAAETVERFLDIDIDYTAQVDFRGFERIVNTMGGLTIDIPQPLLDPEYPTEDFGFERIYIPPGLQVLDGHTALRYARSRHSGSDFDRSCRQQRVLRAMLRDARERNILDQVSLLPEIVEDLEDSVATTMHISDPATLYSLAEFAQSLTADRIMQFSINPSNVQIIAEQGSDIYWNEDDIELLVTRMMEGPVEQEEVARIQVLNGAGVRGLATRVTNNLGIEGFSMVEPGDATRVYEHTLIIDYTEKPETRQRLVNLLGIEARYVQAVPAEDAPPAPYNTDIVVVLGEDYDEAWALISEQAPSVPPPVPAVTEPAEEVPNLPPSCSPDF